MTSRPRATSSRTSSASRSSRPATYSISGVIAPRRAASSCVITGTPSYVAACGVAFLATPQAAKSNSRFLQPTLREVDERVPEPDGPVEQPQGEHGDVQVDQQQ